MSIVTKFGDKGNSKTWFGSTLPKYDLIFSLIGTFDELSSYIGILIARAKDYNDLSNQLEKIQMIIFEVNAFLSGEGKKEVKVIAEIQQYIDEIEKWIYAYEEKLPKLTNFILPQNWFHIARTICRKAERKYFRWAEKLSIISMVGIYLNRLSDYLFVAGRFWDAINNIKAKIYKGNLIVEEELIKMKK